MNKYIQLLLLFYFVFLVRVQAQKKSYDGQGAVSEIIMASPAETVAHFDLFFDSKVAVDEAQRQMYWYKIIFAKDCFFDFTLFPLFETDRYSFITFKAENDPNYCDAKNTAQIVPINDIKVERKFKDTEQSEAFRANLVFTKKVQVKAGDAIYVVIKHLWGADLGHIVGLNTCDYSYVLKAEKVKTKSDSLTKEPKVYSELQLNEALDVIAAKLCPPDGKSVKLGTINFNKKNFDVANKNYLNGTTKDGGVKKIVPTDVTPIQVIKPVEVPKIAPIVTVAQKDSVVNIKPVVKTQSITDNKVVAQKTVVTNKSKPNNTVRKLKKLQDTSLVPVRCIISDINKGFAIDNSPVITDELTGKPLDIKRIKSGEYELAVEKGKNYKVECNAIGYKNFDYSLNIYKALKGEGNDFEIKLQSLQAGENFILRNIYFHPNTPVIKTESNKELEKLYAYMKNNPDAIISIEGHTNSNRHIDKDSKRQQMGGKWAFHGSAKKLSRNRADEVKNYLEKRGVKEDRVKTKGWGGDKELYPNAKTLDESTKNMRVEVIILKI